jgi:hypothetical protein
MKWPKRYFTGLTDSQKVQRARELIKRRTDLHPKLSATNRLVKPKRSSWTVLFHRVYPGRKPRLTGKLKTVYDRGLKAWQTSGSRPGATAQQWGLARVYKFILVSKGKAKNTRIDPDQNLRPWRGSF